jgi:hypothetical protein
MSLPAQPEAKTPVRTGAVNTLAVAFAADSRLAQAES